MRACSLVAAGWATTLASILNPSHSWKIPDWTRRDPSRARELRDNATPAERKLWEHLRRRQLGVRFSRQVQVGRIYPDFLCRELDLIVECDGISHDREPEKDARRDA